MKSTTAATLVLALSTLVAGQAMAGNIDFSNSSELDFAMNVATQPSTKTRADVRAELAQVKRSNIDLSNPSELDFAYNANNAPVKSRADIAQAQVEPAPVEFAQAQ